MLIETRNKLLKEIDTLLKPKVGQSISKIDFICPNFNEEFILQEFKPKNLVEEIFNKISSANNIKQENITIHSFDELNTQKILKKDKHPTNKYKLNIMRYYNKENDIIKALIESIRKSAGLKKEYDDLMSMLDDIKSIKDIKVNLLETFKETIIKQIENVINESDLFNDIIKNSNKTNLTEIIDTLDNYIKQAIDNKNDEMLKNIIKTICGVMLVFVTGGSAAILLLGASAALLSSLIEYQKLQDKKYNYIKNPIIEFLATELAMYIQLTNTRLLSCIIIVTNTINNSNDSKIEFIDLSGFSLNIYDTLLSCSQNLAFKGEFTYNNKININELLQQYYISTTPIIQSKAFETKTLNIHKHQDKQKKQDIKKHLLLDTIIQETRKLNHLVYIESPYFNSALLAEIFNNKNNQYPSNHTTKIAKNYLFITNASNKYNAKLTETITESITNNKIKDDINNRTKKNLTISYQNNNSSYNAKRDYSTYRIEIKKKDDEPYLLQLSPFVRVDSKKVKDALENSKEYKNTKNELTYEHKLDIYTREDFQCSLGNTLTETTENKLYFIKNSYGLDYIESFFKSPKEIADIIANEEQIAKDYLNQLQKIANDTKQGQTLLQIFIIFYGLYIFKINFPSFKLKIEVKKTKYYNSLHNQHIQVSCLKEKWQFNIINETRHMNYDISIQTKHNFEITEKLFELFENLDNQNKDISFNNNFLQNLNNLVDNKTMQKNIKDDIKDLGLNIDIENAIQENYQEISKYGKKYIEILQQQSIEKAFSESFLKLIVAICPFFNFISDDMINKTKYFIITFIQTLENIQTSKNLGNALYQTLFKEMGIFAFFLNPEISAYIATNNEVATKGKQFNKASSIKEKIAKRLKSKNLDDFFKGFTQVELRHTREQIAYFEAKSAFILDKKIELEQVKKLNLVALKEELLKYANKKFDKRIINNLCFYYNANNKHQPYLIGEVQAKEVFLKAKQFHINKILHPVKLNIATAGVDVALGIALDYFLPTHHYEAYKREYDSIIHKRYTFYYDLPYAVKRDERAKESIVKITPIKIDNKLIETTKRFTYYPMLVNSKFISFDMQSMMYGTELCTGGLTHHIGLAYHLRQTKDSNKIIDFSIDKLLRYLIIDEKRGAKDINDIELDIEKQIPDYTWFHHKSIDAHGSIIDKEIIISKDDIIKYQVPKSRDKNSLYQQFKALEEDEDDESAIDAYNEALAILNDYKDYYFTHTRKFNAQGVMLSYKEDKNKARRLLKCLNIIGQNNIRALYVGTSIKSKGKKRPKFIGRLATTIIIEDGLWVG